MVEAKDSFSKGVVFMLLSASGLAVVGLLAKLGLNCFDIKSLIFFRYIATLAIFTVILIFKWKLKSILSLSNLKMNMLRAFFVATAQYSFFYYLKKQGLLNATTLLNTGPIFVSLIDWSILRNRVGKSTWIALAISFIGVLLVVQPDGGILSWVSLVGLLSGIAQGASQVVFGHNATKEDSDTSLFYLFLFCSCIFSIPYFFFEETYIDPCMRSWPSLILIVAIGLASVCNQATRSIAYKNSKPSRLGPFFYFSVVLAGILDWVVLHQVPNSYSIAGASLVVIGGVLKIYLRSKTLKK